MQQRPDSLSLLCDCWHQGSSNNDSGRAGRAYGSTCARANLTWMEWMLFKGCEKGSSWPSNALHWQRQLDMLQLANTARAVGCSWRWRISRRMVSQVVVDRRVVDNQVNSLTQVQKQSTLHIENRAMSCLNSMCPPPPLHQSRPAYNNY
jgi:hypothetical protein